MFLFLLLLWRPNLRGRCLRRVRSWRGWTDGFRPVEILFVVVVLDVDFGQLVLRFSPTLLMIELLRKMSDYEFVFKHKGLCVPRVRRLTMPTTGQ